MFWVSKDAHEHFWYFGQWKAGKQHGLGTYSATANCRQQQRQAADKKKKNNNNKNEDGDKDVEDNDEIAIKVMLLSRLSQPTKWQKQMKKLQ